MGFQPQSQLGQQGFVGGSNPRPLWEWQDVVGDSDPRWFKDVPSPLPTTKPAYHIPPPHVTRPSPPKQFLSFLISALVSNYPKFITHLAWNYLLLFALYKMALHGVQDTRSGTVCKMTNLHSLCKTRWLICTVYVRRVTEVKFFTP